jgi:hypothetical protein
MPAYIPSNLMSKYNQPSPQRIETLEMLFLAEEADEIDQVVENYRGKYRKPLNEEMRALHRKASTLWSKYYQLDQEHNKEYHAFWSS